MSSPLNSPLEYGMRVLVMLTEAYPVQLDVNQLVLLDHSVLHTADLGGPPSIHPSHVASAGELGVRRATLEEGLRVMLRAGLIDMRTSRTGIRYEAGDEAHSFVSALSSNYIAELRRRSHWVVEQFGTLTDEQVRQRMGALFGSWSEELGRDGEGEHPWTG